jgi:hypothetical protein
MWSRLQTIIALYAIFYGGILSNVDKFDDLTNLFFKICILSITIIMVILTFYIYLFLLRDRDIRDKVSKMIDPAGDILNTKILPVAKSKYSMPVIFLLLAVFDILILIVILFNSWRSNIC